MCIRDSTDTAVSTASGFFAWVEGASGEGYRAPRTEPAATAVAIGAKPVARPTAVLTGSLGARVISPLIDEARDGGNLAAETRVVAVDNDFFGGNVGVTGLMVGEDLRRVLAAEPEGDRYLLPDVCLSQGRFLDGLGVDDLPRPVEVISTDGISLRRALGIVGEW